MAFLGCALQPLEHLQEVVAPGGPQDAPVELHVVDFGLHACLAGLLQTREARHSCRSPGVGGNGYVVTLKQALQGLDVALLGVADVQEGSHRPEILQHLGIGGPGAVLVIEGVVEGLDFRRAEG